MLRSRLKTLPQVRFKYKLNASRSPAFQNVRFQSSTSESGGGMGKFFAKLIGVTAVAGGGVIGYAKYDPTFRTLVEDKLPYSNFLFEYTLDFMEDKKQPTKPVVEKPSDIGLLKKKLERTAAEKEKPTISTNDSKQDITPVEKKKVSEKHTKKDAVETRIDEEAEAAKLEKRLAAQESEINRKNKELEKQLIELKDDIESKIEEAVKSQKKAAKAFRRHAEMLNKALDESQNDFDSVEWSEISDLNVKKQETINKARTSINSASEVIAHLKSVIEEARTNKHTAANKNLFNAEDAIHSALNKLAKAEKQFLEAQFEDKMATQYKDSLEKAREALENELKAISPNFSLAELGKNSDFTTEQINQCIVLFHRKIDQSHKVMSKQLATEQLRIKEAILKQKEEDDFVSDNMLNMELARQAREMNVVQQKKIQEMKDEFDNELRLGLRRQLTAHVEHVQQCLKTQATELEKEYKELINEEVLEEKGRNELLLSGSFAKLNAIQDLLKSRESLDKAAKKAKELWLACQMLKNTLKVGRLGEPGLDSNLKPLDQELSAVKKAAGEANPFVESLVKSVPEEALTRGVYTEEALRERFLKVERICRRVAMVDETGGSLFKYFISYLQSFFILPPTVSSEEIENDIAIDPSSLGTFDIISRVNLCLQQDNLLQALRYMNLLKGEPRNVARDWIKELKILLEARQVADALIAHAAATSIQAYH